MTEETTPTVLIDEILTDEARDSVAARLGEMMEEALGGAPYILVLPICRTDKEDEVEMAVISAAGTKQEDIPGFLINFGIRMGGFIAEDHVHVPH